MTGADDTGFDSAAARYLDREQLEAEFITECLRIVGPDADPAGYAVAPDTSDELLLRRLGILQALPSNIGHDELLGRVGPRRSH